MPKKRNKAGTRKVEQRLIIVCEGKKDKSESSYFKSFIKSCSFRGNKVEVQLIDTNKNTGKELVQEAKENREFSNDILWVVYDKDGYTKHPDTFESARQNKVKIGFSAISFEYWILLHYECTSRPFRKSEEVIKYLKDKGYIKYAKNSQDVYHQTKGLLSRAISNAKKIRKDQLSGNPKGTRPYQFDSYSNLDELIEDIRKLEN